MRDHRFDAEETALRPKAARVEESVPDHVGRAATEGRSDVLGPSGLLGLQRAVGNSGVSALVEEDRSPVHDVVGSGGRPLDAAVRSEMEGRLGHDFSDVRVHDDSRAHASAEAVNAHAYTVGSNIVFQRGRFDPASQAGKVTLAHELTHVVQQRSGPVDGTPAAGGIKVSDPGDRFEREASANAERVVADPAPVADPVAAPVTAPVSAPGSAVQPAVQREEEAAEDEESVQGSFADVQREEEAEEEETPA